MKKVIVVGLGATGEAVARRLAREGRPVLAVDDMPDDAARRTARSLGIDLLEKPDRYELQAASKDADFVVASPGVPVSHPVYELGLPAISEIELAWEAATSPLIAITGTNGKTTVTRLVAMMLNESGIKAVAAGNIGIPLIDAVQSDAEVIVAEVSSFQLAFTRRFRPRVAVWLNASEDHLDWHPSMSHYLESKARVWANQRGNDLTIVNAEDEVVMSYAATAPARVATFGRRKGDFHESQGALRTPSGEPISRLERMQRRLPHDLSNGLASSAAALAIGATIEGCRAVLESFRGFPHRVELVGEARGVRYYDDSKSTTPASVIAATSGFDSVVLIAGGRNKRVDLGVLRAARDRIRSVVAIGEAASEVEAAFSGVRPVQQAQSMDEAVARAADLALPGDAVVLSPGCASFDWYRSYEERGEAFARAVKNLFGREELRGQVSGTENARGGDR